MSRTATIEKKAIERISPEKALELYRSDDLFELGQRAQAVRFAHNPEKVVTYNVNRNINYTNVCNAGCRFCAFYRVKGHEEAYVLEEGDFTRKIDELIAAGGTEVLLQGGHHEELPLSFYTDLLTFLANKYPQVTLHAFSPPEIVHLAKRVEKTSIQNVMQALHQAGLRTMPGGGAEILVDRVRRKMAAAKCSTDEWLEVMETAHGLGIGTTATMMFGHIETVEDRIEHLHWLRQLQERTGGFRAFIAWTFQEENTFWQGKVRPPRGSYDYLKTLAMARILTRSYMWKKKFGPKR